MTRPLDTSSISNSNFCRERSRREAKIPNFAPAWGAEKTPIQTRGKIANLFCRLNVTPPVVSVRFIITASEALEVAALGAWLAREAAAGAVEEITALAVRA